LTDLRLRRDDPPGFVAFAQDFWAFLQIPETAARRLAIPWPDRLRLAGGAAFVTVLLAGLVFAPLGKLLAVLVGGAASTELDWPWLDDESPIAKLVWGVVLAPLAEETAYRLALLPTPWRAAVAMGPLVLLLPRSTWESANPLVVIGVVWAIAGIARRPLALVLSHLGLRRLLLLQAGLFALGHLPNFTNAHQLIRVVPAVLPQFFYGFVFAYVRLRLGFWYACITHGACNLIIDGLLG
jgi:hypothetical protein